MKYSNQLPDTYDPADDELSDATKNHSAIDRRKFFKIFGGGLAVAFVLHDLLSFADEAANASPPSVPASQVAAWIHIGEDGKVSVYTGKVEVGQNIRTSLSQIVAEELKVPVASITMIMGDTDLVPFDAGTFGSRSTPQMGNQLRKAAATAREAIIDLAAKTWNSEAKLLKAEDGQVLDTTTGKKLGYGQVTKGQQLLLPISDQAPVTAAKDWKVAGRTVHKVNGASFITGKHQYVSDMKLPGMLFGKVLRAPSYNARLVSVDTKSAAAMAGVSLVHEGDFIAVAAADPVTARKALQAIEAKWEENKQQPSNATIFDHLVKTAESRGGRNSPNNKGDIRQGLSTADFKHSQSYNINYIAHVPLEPRAALAQWVDGKLTVWTGTQRPFGVQDDLAGVFSLPKEKVRVIMPDTGSGYGGKHSGEAAIEAARISKLVHKPVKVLWTREEEFTWAYFRPGGVIKVESGLKADGTISAWKFVNYNSGGAGLSTQYKIPNHEIAHLPSDTPLKQGSYRGLASTANVFARESHITEMAMQVKMDQLEFRLKNLDDVRLKSVLEMAATTFGWGEKNKTPGQGFGLACGYEKGGYVATCVEVMVNSDKEVKVVRVTEAFECGAIVNPLHLENQVMGSIVQGLGGALFESIDFAEGKILNGGLNAYRVPRFSDMPKIEIVTIDRKDLPSAGAGEAAILGIAPAIRNAILDATGIALTSLPLLPTGSLG